MKKSILFFVVAALFVAFNASLNAQEAGNQDSKSCVNVAPQQTCIYWDGEVRPIGFGVHVVDPLPKNAQEAGNQDSKSCIEVHPTGFGVHVVDPLPKNAQEAGNQDSKSCINVAPQGGPVGGSYRSNPHRVYSTRP